MIKIYCIEDINDLKYVGSTCQELRARFSHHKSKRNCSSSKLNLHNSIIYLLEECNEENRKERERYWINKLDTINIKKLNAPDKYREYKREWHKKNYKKKKIENKK